MAVNGAALIALALAVLLLPLRWLGAAILAAVVHELCHWAAVKLCGGRVQRMSAGILGAEMAVSGLSPWQELFCALAGPAGGLVLLSLSRFLPRTALCAGLQSLYNLLPIYPLDGGRALRCLCAMILPERAGDRVCETARILCLSGIGFWGFYGTFFLHLGIVPIALAAAMIAKEQGRSRRNGLSIIHRGCA